MGDFSGLEAECFVESYEHEWCAFVGFLALARTLSLTPIAPAKASSVLRPLICLVRSRKPSRNCILYSAISDSFRNLEFLFATCGYIMQLFFFISQLARRVDLQPLWLHNETMNKETWFKETVQGDTIAEVALKAGIIKTTAWRQYNNALGFSAENVILIARAYHKSPVEALVEFGYIRADEMTSGETVARLHDASNDELLQELARRLKENADADWVNSPIIYREEFDMAANDDPNARLEAETPED